MTDTKKYDLSNWRQRDYVNLPAATQITGVSPATLYRAQAAGQLEFRRLSNRVVVTVRSLIAYVDGAEVWTASSAGEAARSARRA